ncbi:MAG TPA: protein kinase [Trichormus sp.]
MVEEIPQNDARPADAHDAGTGENLAVAIAPGQLPAYSLIGDRYQIIDMLGRGGMGTVLRARHIKLNKLVAIKVLNPAILVDESSKLRFEQEAKACGKLTHPNLIAVFDYGFTPNDEPYLAMEYVQGESLEALIERNGPLSTSDFVRIFSQLCKPLQFIHKNGIIHRDLKPSNIMLHNIEDEQYVKLLDFGIAKVLPDPGAASQHLTATGMVYGSPIYMSPEQCRGKNVDARSDIYSLGCVMYQCAAGHAPFAGENILQTLFMHANDMPPPLPPTVDPQVATIILKCLQKLPADRFQTPNDLQAAINKIQSVGLSNPQQSAASLNVVDRSRQSPGTSGSGMMSSRLMQPGGSRSAGLGSVAGSAPAPETDTNTDAAEVATNGGDSAAANIRSARFAHTEEPRGESRPKFSSRQAEKPLAEPKQIPVPALAGAGIALVALACFTAFKFGVPAFKQFQFTTAMQQGESAFKAGDWVGAEVQYNHASTLADADDNDALGKINRRLGAIKLEQHLDAQACKNFSLAIKKLEPHKNVQKDAYLDAIFGMAETLSQQGSNQQAEEYFAKARSLANDSASPQKQAEIDCASGQNYRNINLGKSLEFFDQGIDAYGKADPVPEDKLADAWINSAAAAALQGTSPESGRRAQQAMLVCAKVTDPTVKMTLETRCTPFLQTADGNGAGAPTASPAAPATTMVLPPVDTSNPAVAIEQLKLQQAQVQLEDTKTRQAALSNLNQFITQHNQRLNDAVTPQLQRLNNPAAFAPPANNYAQQPQLQPVHQLYVPQQVNQAPPSEPARSAPVPTLVQPKPVRSAPKVHNPAARPTPAPIHSSPQRPSSAPQQSRDEPFWR